MHLLFNCPYCRKFLFKLPSTNIYNPSMLEWFASLVIFWGCVGRFIHSRRKSNTYSDIQLSDWKDPEVKSLHGSFTPNMRCMPLQHYLEHWCAWPCYGSVVRRLGFQGSPAIFFGEAFHLHNPNGKKGPTGFWS